MSCLMRLAQILRPAIQAAAGIGRPIVVCAAILCVAEAAPGQTFVWNGGGASPAWDAFILIGGNPFFTNWGTVPVLPGAGHNVVFGSAFTSGNPNLNGDRAVLTLTVSATSPFALTGAALDVLTLQTGNLVRSIEAVSRLGVQRGPQQPNLVVVVQRADG